MVEVIIPTWNARETLPKALDSLVAQTKQMFLVCLSIDCDGVDYSDIIEEYERRGLHIRTCHTEKNGGPGVARQRGIDTSKMCDYIMFLDSDDLLMPRAIELLYSEAKKNNTDIIASNFLAEKTGTPGYLYRASQAPITWTHGKIYKISYLRENNIRFKDDLRLNEDSYFNLVAWNATNSRARVDEITYYWRDNKNSLTRQGEDSLDFFKKSHAQYVYSQVCGILKLAELNPNADYSRLFAETTLNIYNHFELAVHYKLDVSEDGKYLHMLKDSNVLLPYASNKNFWEQIDKNVRCSQMADNMIFFHKDRYIDWAYDHILKEN